MRRARPFLSVCCALLLLAVCVLGSAASTPYPTPPPLALRIGFGGSVNALSAPAPAPTPQATGSGARFSPEPSSLPCTAKGGTVLIVPTVLDPNGNPFCITASTQGITANFKTALPFVAPASLTCTELHEPGNPARDVVSFELRVGRRVRGVTVYDGARARCALNAGLAYVFSVEKQTVANDPNTGRSIPAGQDSPRALVVPWSLLHLTRHAESLLVRLALCEPGAACSSDVAQFVVPLLITEGSASVGVATDPYVHLETPTPKPAATPFRIHNLQIDGALNWDAHDIVSATFSQNQSYVADQRALSQALSLAPVSLPVSAPTISVTQTLQLQSQDLFGFQMPSEYLEDPSLKPLFDVLPFSVSRIGSLASGYSYGYSSDTIKAGAFYGMQAPGSYAGGATVALAVATPRPTPNPSPTPTPVQIIVTGAQAPQVSPLRPPPPPAPFFESGTANVPPFEVTLTNGFSGSPGKRDAIDALAFEGHEYRNRSSPDSYLAETFNVYGRVEHDFEGSNPAGSSSLSQFVGESGTLTAAGTSTRPAYLQVRESAAYQQNDPFFSPGAGTVTWLAPLSGPVGHVTVSYAGGPKARFFSLDLIGFRLSNGFGGFASEEGWQMSVPLPDLLKTSGWLLTGGSQTQTVSDRMAVLEQGVLPTYASAFAETSPTPSPQAAATAIRPERLGNGLLLSPWLGNELQASLAVGYDFGTVTGCGTITSATIYQCLTETNNRTVGGIFLRTKSGAFGAGATDTSTTQGNVTAGSAARNLGTAGALPGSVTSYVTYKGCPNVSAAYSNAAFPTGVPLPQQGATLSLLVDQPIVIRSASINLTFGYFNERTSVNPALNQSGIFGMIKISTPFQRVAASCRA